jgi:Tol biopolymer transport system component
VPATGGNLNTLATFEHGDLNLALLRPVASASPDGKYVVFEEGVKGGRDIMLVSTDDKKTIHLTEDPADDAQPFWSTDGRYVIFKTNRHGSWALWGLPMKEGKPDGPALMIAAGFNGVDLLSLSRAGLAYTRAMLVVDVYKMPVDPSSGKPTGAAQQIPYTPTGSNIFPTWSPDGKQFAFVSNRGGVSGPGYLVTTSVEGGKQREFRIPMDYAYWTYYFSDLSWSPDGRRVAFSGKDEKEKPNIYILTLETGAWEKLALEGVGIGARIQWGGDDTTYFCALMGKGIVKRHTNSEEEQFIYKPTSDETGMFIYFRVSRDRKWLAVQEDTSRILTIDVETGKTNVMYEKGYFFPCWSPNGKRLMAIRRAGKILDLVTLARDGGDPQRIDLGDNLPKGLSMGNPEWSPDGNKLLFATGPGWIFENYLMRTVIPEEQQEKEAKGQ